MKKLIVSVSLAAAMLTAGCSADTSSVEVKTETAQKSLYERLGGRKNIEAVVYKLWEYVSKDDRINHYFSHTKPEAFAGLLTDFLCVGAGGPCEYKGRTMRETHTGMHITEADFNALAEDTVKALDFYKVPEKEKNEVMNMLAGLKGDVVGH